MADERFFPLAGPFTLKELSTIAKAEIGGDVSPDTIYKDVAPLSEATISHISFLDNKIYIKSFTASNAGACLVHPDLVHKAPTSMALLVTKQPYHAYARVAEAFHPYTNPESTIHPNAVISSSATIAANVSIGAGCVISDNVKIDKNTHIAANTIINQGVTIGLNCTIGSNITLQCCDIGNDVIIHPGVCIGQDGFGFALGGDGHLKVPQLGNVLIGNNVEIGANSTIDRGTGPNTIIGDGCKIDNLVQIGHNVQMGMGCVIVSQTGISGSTKLGNFVIVGGQAGIAGHLDIGDGAQIAGKSGVMRNISPGGKVGGVPAQPMKDWFRGVATLERLSKKKKG